MEQLESLHPSERPGKLADTETRTLETPPQSSLPPEAQLDQPWPATVPNGTPTELSGHKPATADTPVIPLNIAEKFPELVAAKEDARNQMQAARYEHDARTFVNPRNLREVPCVSYLDEHRKPSTVSFDAMAHDGTLIDRKLRSAGSSFDRAQLLHQSEALKQLSERTGVPFQVRWEVSDENVAAQIQKFIEQKEITNITATHVPFPTETSVEQDFSRMTAEELAEFHEHWKPYLDESDKNIGIEFVTDTAPDSAGAYVYEWDARQKYGWPDERCRPALPSGTGGKRDVRFDAVDTDRGCFIDRKLGKPSNLNGTRAQDAALKHTGKPYEVVWQVPDQKVKNEIEKMLAAAYPKITQIRVEVVSYNRSELMRAWRAANPDDGS